jgi:iron complex outermembrane receptor protein
MQRPVDLTLFKPRLAWAIALVVCLVCGSTQAASDEALFSEQEYLQEIPQVFAASRLPQHPQDSSGANTVLDQSYIQASGARNLSELFLGVPGFQVGLNAGGRPVIAYHGFSGDVSQRMQVFVDGRSLYAPYKFGGVDWSAVTVPLSEIERIEIHRGSNSAAYGANAFLGVIQIYTRAAVQATGISAEVIQGSNGIADRALRWGHSEDELQWRLVAGHQSDQGLLGRSDGFTTDSLDFRADYQKSAAESVVFLTGTNRGRFGVGSQNSIADPERTEHQATSFAHAKYKNLVDDGQEWSLSASWTHDSGHNGFQIPLLSGSALDIYNSRQADRYSLEYQHYNILTPHLRASWGAEFHSDEVQSRELFSTDVMQRDASWRAYYNQEWKPFEDWTLNLGGLVEKDLYTTVQFAPRLSINWKLSDNHVLKWGYSSAFRTPSLFEQKSDWRVLDENGQTLYIKYLSRGGLVPERIRSTDLVYLGQWAPLNMGFDLRIFREELTRLITGQLYSLPDTATSHNAVAYDLRNNASALQQGAEYQLNWKPLPGSTLSWIEYRAKTTSTKPAVQDSVPTASTSLVWNQRADNGLNLFVAYSKTSPMTWLGEPTSAGSQKILAISMQKAVKLEQANVRTSLSWRLPMGQFVEYRELQFLPRSVWLSVQIDR